MSERDYVDFIKTPLADLEQKLAAANARIARFIVECDQLFHSYAIPFEKSDNDKAFVRFSEAVRHLVYEEGKDTPRRAREALEGKP